jgi:hypothetical protein
MTKVLRPSTNRHDRGTLLLPTRAHFADRLEANGSGRWVSHLSGVRVTRMPRRGPTEVRR